MFNLARFPVCAICTRPLQLETCKVDELGKAVHEGCYLLKISLNLARGQPKPREDVAAITTGNPLRRAIVDFLDSASIRSAPIFCPDCRSAVSATPSRAPRCVTPRRSHEKDANSSFTPASASAGSSARV